jgi:hypothetical protein
LVTPVICTEKVRLGLLKTPLPKIGMAMIAVADPDAKVVVPVVGVKSVLGWAVPATVV